MKLINEKPSEVIRRAFFKDDLIWQQWGNGWLQANYILKPIPGDQAQVEQFINWWNKSRQLDCLMLPPLQRQLNGINQTDIDESMNYCILEENQYWLCCICQAKSGPLF